MSETIKIEYLAALMLLAKAQKDQATADIVDDFEDPFDEMIIAGKTSGGGRSGEELEAVFLAWDEIGPALLARAAPMLGLECIEPDSTYADILQAVFTVGWDKARGA